MELTEFIEKFVEQFDDAPQEQVLPGTKYRDLTEWSSLLALAVMAMIDEEYDVQLRAEEMRGTNTIQELYDVVKSHK